MAMQGMLANTAITVDCEKKQDPTVIARAAVSYADIFIEALNK